jgi:hypothetical protein
MTDSFSNEGYDGVGVDLDPVWRTDGSSIDDATAGGFVSPSDELYPAPVYIEEEERAAAACVMRSAQMRTWCDLIPVESFETLGLFVTAQMAARHEERGDVATWKGARLQPEWFGKQLARLVNDQVQTEMLQHCSFINYGNPAPADASSLRKLTHAHTAVEIAAMMRAPIAFFAAAVRQDETDHCIDVISQHQRQQGVVPQMPDFFTNIIVPARQDGHKGSINTQRLNICEVQNIRTITGCRSVGASPLADFTVAALERLGIERVSHLRLVPVRHPPTYVTGGIENIPAPVFDATLSAAPLVFHADTSTIGADTFASKAQHCAPTVLSFKIPLYGTAKVFEISGVYECTETSRIFVTRHAVLNEIFNWTWQKRRVGRRLDQVTALADIQVGLLPMLSEALVALQRDRTEACGL